MAGYIEEQLQRVSLTGKKTPLREIQVQDNVGETCTEEDLARVASLMKKARSAVEEGHPRAALQLLQEAAKIQRTEKIEKRIAKLEAYLAENGSENEDEEDDSMVHVGKGFYLYKELYDRMYDYQRESLLWFWRLHRKKKGGILGDDMGLGKTVQVVAFLSGLYDMEQVSSILIVVPVALIINWEKEFKRWAPGISVYCFHSATKRERERVLERVQRKGGVMMISYGLVMTCWEQINHHHGADFVWDYVILDEGHKIKNPTKTTKAIHAVQAHHRFILTGTPIQNNLKELWSLFNFVSHGTLLGTLQTFKSEYETPITRAREKDATASEKLLGNEMAESLRLLIAPYFLRRSKADVLEGQKSSATEGDASDDTDSISSSSTREGRSLSPQNTFPSLTRKNDFIVWLSLTETQIQIYKDFIGLDRVKELLMTKRSPLAELTILKKLCDHPRLLSNRACRQLGLEMSEDGYDENDEESLNEMQSAANNIHNISDEALLMESGKLQFLVQLLGNLRMEGHRCLVFSQSRKMLDIVEKVLKARHFKLMRLDGTITKLSDREERISRFQGNHSYTVFLLTTQVGGVGLTLTGADRVVIIDPSWNPATDNQAVDRAYRIGQTKSVVIYRLITCGTVEEKIYRRQIFKESLTKQTTGNSKNPYRYFTRQELKELFVLDDPKTSKTQMQLEEMHASQRKTDTDLDAHIAFLYSLDIFGISDHDLMFSQEAQIEAHQDFDEDGNLYVQQRVQRAQDLVAAESDLTRKLNDHIQRGTETPGSTFRKRYSMNINRERLHSEWAEKTGEGVLNPPLQNVPKFYRPEIYNRPSANVDVDVEDLDRTMEEMTLNETGRSSSDETGDHPVDHEDEVENIGDDDDELIIIESSPPAVRGSNVIDVDADEDASRPSSVMVITDDSRPTSRVEDKAFIEDESDFIAGAGDSDDNGEDNNEGDVDEQAEGAVGNDDGDNVDFDLGLSDSDPRIDSRSHGMGDDGADESLELVVGRSPPKPQVSYMSPREDGQDEEVDGASLDPVSLGEKASSSVSHSGGLGVSGRQFQMPSDSESYGLMETSGGQPSDLPHFNATRQQLSFDASASMVISRRASKCEDSKEEKVNTIQWENGDDISKQTKDQQGSSVTAACQKSQEHPSDEQMAETFKKPEMKKFERDDEYDDISMDDVGSDAEIVEVSVASFCCQADAESSQEDVDVTEDAGHGDDEEVNDEASQKESIRTHMDERNKEISGHEGNDSFKSNNSEEDENDDISSHGTGEPDEESYIDVSVASFCVQAGGMNETADMSQS